MINLGGKIALDKLNAMLDNGNTILVREINGELQSDIRIRKVGQVRKMDKGYKTIKAHYMVNIELGKTGFENFIPKEIKNEQSLRFHSLDRALNMLEVKEGLKRRDWVIEGREASLNLIH